MSDDPTQEEGKKGSHLRLVKKDETLLDQVMNMSPVECAQYSIETLKRAADEIELELEQDLTKEDVMKTLNKAHRVMILTGYLLFDLAKILKDL